MNPAYQRVIQSIVQRLIIALGMWLTTHGALTKDEADALVSPTVDFFVGILIQAFGFGYGALRAWWTQQFINTAVAMPTTTVAAVEAKIASGVVAPATTPKTDVPIPTKAA